MDQLIELLDNPKIVIYLLTYLGVVIGGQILYGMGVYVQKKSNYHKRKLQGLPEEILINNSERLASRRVDALFQSGLLLATILLTPFTLIAITQADKDTRGLGIAFLVLFGWILSNGTDLITAFIGGLAFKTVVAFKQPFQIGDRITVQDVSGKVIKFNTFFLVLQTLDHDRISIPTHTLWTEIVSSANAGNLSSLCVMNFYLASFVNAEQRQKAEDAIWDAIQASVYYDSSKPMQIYLIQTPEAIQLTAKAYVACTYNEPLFVSDVTRAFLDFVSKEKIALAPGSWELSPDDFTK
ncbi:mechanosensitive ion channel domain-containing protein [Crocosphaera sp.]|uniref:mechanosensitive ion channel domain-containing protein n=1 Tax=Crocosphaera sp. TaxID=2729996 RepID=UPI002615C0B0|nr:mechanosensitive ion channel domain-containing protein [Crocosphaera sp.]MDJ0582190.1 mechanosensitive ion channel [Crocosphaera sp.]